MLRQHIQIIFTTLFVSLLVAEAYQSENVEYKENSELTESTQHPWRCNSGIIMRDRFNGSADIYPENGKGEKYGHGWNCTYLITPLPGHFLSFIAKTQFSAGVNDWLEIREIYELEGTIYRIPRAFVRGQGSVFFYTAFNTTLEIIFKNDEDDVTDGERTFSMHFEAHDGSATAGSAKELQAQPCPPPVRKLAQSTRVFSERTGIYHLMTIACSMLLVAPEGKVVQFNGPDPSANATETYFVGDLQVVEEQKQLGDCGGEVDLQRYENGRYHGLSNQLLVHICFGRGDTDGIAFEFTANVREKNHHVK